MKTAMFIIASLLVTVAMLAQDNTLSKDKQLELRNAQVERLQVRIALDQAKVAFEQASQADSAAQAKMSALVTEACKGAGLKNEECQVCDGPGPEGAPVEACKGLKSQELAVRKLVKKDEKAEVKKP